MLGKLFKYEFKNTAKMMLMIYAVLIVTTCIGTLALRSTLRLDSAGAHPSPVVTMLIVGAIILYVLSLFAFFIVTYVYMCIHFYKTMYSAQGYLTHTLPVKQLTTFHVKLVTSFVWMFAALLLFIGSVFFLLNGVTDGEFWEIFSREFITGLDSELTAIGFHTGGMIVQFLFSAALSCLIYLLWVFASASIGQLFSTNKVLASVVTGIIFYVVNQALNLIIMLVSGYFNFATLGGGVLQTTTDTVNTAVTINNSYMIVQNIYSIIAVIALYSICNVIVRKHINLE